MSYGDPATPNAHTWALKDDDAQPFFRQAVEMSVTFWDTANTYRHGTSEEVVGRAIKRYSRREDGYQAMDRRTATKVLLTLCRRPRHSGTRPRRPGQPFQAPSRTAQPDNRGDA
jgi:aryl-alcohol dehydrogenase-like predicted oxidoreductase